MRSLFLFLATVAFGQAANFPTDFQAGLRLYASNKFPEARAAFEPLIASAPSPEAKDVALAQASYCEAQLKHGDAATALAAGIKDKSQSILCRMNILTIQTKYADVWALSKAEDFTTWPDALIYDAYVCRGNAASRLRQTAEAEKDFRAALGATINDYKQAVVYLQLGRLAQGPAALACYDEIMKLKAPGGTMRYQAVAARARLLAAEGKGALALAEFDRVGELTKQPHWSMVQMARAATHETLGETAKARACYEAIISASQPPADLLATAKAKLAALR
jgi:hypothetical protein